MGLKHRKFRLIKDLSSRMRHSSDDWINISELFCNVSCGDNRNIHQLSYLTEPFSVVGNGRIFDCVLGHFGLDITLKKDSILGG